MPKMNESIARRLRPVRYCLYQSVAFCRKPQPMATILHDIINTAYLVLGIRKITLYPSVSIENIQVLTACSHPHIPIGELIERTYPFLIGLRQWNDAEMMRREKKTEYAII